MKATIVGYPGYKAYARFSGTLPISADEGGVKRPGDVTFDKTLFFSVTRP
jgi:hypothetical protein